MAVTNITPAAWHTRIRRAAARKEYRARYCQYRWYFGAGNRIESPSNGLSDRGAILWLGLDVHEYDQWARRNALPWVRG